MGFPGGSAWSMARDIELGVTALNERMLGRFQPAEMDQLAFELDKLLREIRGNQAPLDDLPAIQLRNRRIQRVNGSLLVLRQHRLTARR